MFYRENSAPALVPRNPDVGFNSNKFNYMAQLKFQEKIKIVEQFMFQQENLKTKEKINIEKEKSQDPGQHSVGSALHNCDFFLYLYSQR